MSCTILGPLSSSSVSLPFYSFRVPAGFPSPAQDHIEAEISLDELLDLRAPHMYLVRISGDSMIDAGLFDGDLAIVNRAMPGRPGLIVIAALNGDALVKRLAKEGEQIVLRAENKAYAPRYVLEGDELLIWGVVTHSVHCHAPSL